MTLVQILGLSLLAVIACMAVLWLVSLPLKNSSIVDIFWGPGVLVAAGVYFALTDGLLACKILITALGAIWGLRLGVHILSRNAGKGEDFRYRKWRCRAVQ